MPHVDILGVSIAVLDRASALAQITALHDRGSPAFVAYANAHTLNTAVADPHYRAVLNRADLVLNDGVGVAIAARLKRVRFPANLNGSDLNPAILEVAARRGWRVYFFGARPGVAERAADRLAARVAGLRVVGADHGYLPADDVAGVPERIRRSGASVVMVALGNPRQELWLHDHLAWTGARLGVGVGAFFDFAAGVVPRAPAWMNRMGIEWTYRLYREPRRLARRYLIGNPLFLARVVGTLFRRPVG